MLKKLLILVALLLMPPSIFAANWIATATWPAHPDPTVKTVLLCDVNAPATTAKVTTAAGATTASCNVVANQGDKLRVAIQACITDPSNQAFCAAASPEAIVTIPFLAPAPHQSAPAVTIRAQ